MIIMDPLEQLILRMTELQPKIPSWTKVEHMERCTAQKELWKYADEPNRATDNKRKRVRKEKFSKLFFFITRG